MTPRTLFSTPFNTPFNTPFSTLQSRSLVTLLLSFFLCLPAYGLDLGAAKAQGLVGETTSGYIAAIKASSDVNALVSSVNAKRKAHYQQIANKNGISLHAVEGRAGKTAIAKTTKGQFVNEGAGWKKK
jgi:uncharacterized protein YdbL (DUF1318 family)